MGLDTVELLMEAETRFDVSFSQEEVSELETVGDFHAFVCFKMKESNELDVPPSWSNFRSFVGAELGISSDKIKPESTWRDLRVD